MTETTTSVLTPTTCNAAGCDKPAFGLKYCGTHALVFEPKRATRECRVPRCAKAPFAHGLCQPHYARWHRWKKKTEGGSSREVEVWLKRDWARPVGEDPVEVLQTTVSTRMLRTLFDRLELACGEDETVYQRCRSILEAAAKDLPEPTPAQLRALQRRRTKHARSRS